MKIKFKRVLFSNSVLILLATVALLLGMLFKTPALERAEFAVYDLLMQTRNDPVPSAVIIVGIDEESLNQVGPWPWPRSYLAETIQFISEAGAGAIGLCELYEDRELNPGLQETQALWESLKIEGNRNPEFVPEVLGKLFAEAVIRLDHDEQLISSIRSARNTVLPFKCLSGPLELENDQEEKLSGLMRLNSVGLPQTSVDTRAFYPRLRNYFQHASIQTPQFCKTRETYRALAGKAGALGHMNLVVDCDNTVRRLPLLIPFQERLLPSFALQLATKYKGLTLKTLSVSALKNNLFGLSLRIGDMVIPVDDHYNMSIRYRGPEKTILEIPIADVLRKTIDPGIFMDKIVLIGTTSPNTNTLFYTPMQKKLAEVEVLANATDTILSESFFARPFWARMLEIAVVVYFGVFLLFVIPKVNPRLGRYILGISLAAWVAAFFIAFKTLHVWLWVFPPIVLSVGGYLFIRTKTAADHFRRQIAELNRTLGLTYQAQGLLDMAYEKLMQCPREKDETKQILYDLGMEFERKRLFNKALSVYEHILDVGPYKDLAERVQALRKAGPLVLTTRVEGPSATLVLDDKTVAPTFGRYEIVKELGQGAMGTVYLGKDPKIKRDVAIKTLAYNSVAPEEINEVKSRFFHEAETAGSLSHPNIVTVFDIGEERDMAYMAMELLDGRDLSFHCRKDNLLSVKRVLEIVSTVAEALHYAHQHGVVHRDIKPSNIMLLKSGQVKVTDFGIARVMDDSKTRTGIVLGTPSYMSPEQVAGKKVDGKSDLFSLGVVFYELLTGEKPFKGETLTALMYAITKGGYVKLPQLLPDLVPGCAVIVDKLLNKGLNRRFKSAEAVVQEILHCSEQIDNKCHQFSGV